MNSGSDNPKRPNERSLAKSLGALFALTGGLMLSSAAAANATAAKSNSATTDGTERLEIRVQKIQQKLGQTPGTELSQGNQPPTTAQPMWWGNWHNWHPGYGWHNWHPGWGNGGWGNGGWHNWHNWHNWGNW
jgi:rSAM-associated Gly-rich repeat protein